MQYLAAVALVVMGFAATPAVAFMYEDDPDFCCDRAADLPAEFHNLRDCAEEGISECQVKMGELWAIDSGPLSPESPLLNQGEAERWYLKAAMQGHRRAIDRLGIHLCFLNSVEPFNVEQRAIDTVAWRALLDDGGVASVLDSDMNQGCDSLLALRETPGFTTARIAERATARLAELRAALTTPIHGWDDPYNGLFSQGVSPPGGWSTFPVDGKRYLFRRLEGPPYMEIVDDGTLPRWVVEPAAFFDEADPGFKGTPKADLPAPYHELRACAERGVSECQVLLGDVWKGGFGAGPQAINFGEAEHWYRVAAMQGHRRGIAGYADRLCSLSTVDPGDVVRRAIDSLAWRGLIGGLDIRAYFASMKLELCPSAFALYRMPDFAPSRVIELVRKRAAELRSDLSGPLHGSQEDVGLVADGTAAPPGGWTTVPRGEKPARIRRLGEPPFFEIVRQ